ncbi:MAG: hypothetical protein ACM3YO_06735 [Bacteroidota bacterium]
MKRLPFYPLFFTVFVLLLFGCTQGPGSFLGTGKGSVELRIAGLPQRTTQATLSDVDHIKVDLQTAKNATSKTLAHADLFNGNPAVPVVFRDLWPGAATISVTVYNASNATIGATTANATVISNQVTPVNLSLKLNPTDILAGNLTVVGSILPGATPTPTADPTPTPDPTDGPDIVYYYITSANVALLNNPYALRKDFPPTVQKVGVINSTNDPLTLYLEYSPDGSSFYDYSWGMTFLPGTTTILDNIGIGTIATLLMTESAYEGPW